MGSKAIVSSEKITAIANAIRAKTGNPSTMLLDDMPTQIASIEGGGGDGELSVNAYFEGVLEEVDCDVAKIVNPYAFYENQGIKRVRFANATSVGAYNFQSCENVVSVDFPNATGEIGSGFCNGCKKLNRVNIPQVTKLGNYAFQSCSEIEKIDLPAVQSFGNYCLRYTNGLKALILRYQGGVVAKGSSILSGSGLQSNGYIYVPKALLEDYKNGTNWSSFADRFRAIEDYPAITGG